MATVSETTHRGYAEADEFVQYQIEKARDRIKATDLLTAAVLTALLLFSYLLIFTLLDHWVIEGGFQAWTRAGMLVTVVALCGLIVYRYVLRRWTHRIHPLFAAKMLDNSSEGIAGSLMTLVDLQAEGRKCDQPIHRTLEKRAAVRLAEVHIDEAIDRRLLIRLGAVLFIVVLVTCLYAVFSPKSISLLRPLTLSQSQVATRTVIEAVQPGNSKVPVGSQVQFIADLSGVIPEEVNLLFTTADRRFVDQPLTMRATEDPQRFEVVMIGEGDRGIRQSFQYRIIAGDASSDVYSISVDQPPSARVVQVDYRYPDYMSLPERTDSSGTIEAWEGSTVTIHAESNLPIASAVLQLSDEPTFKTRGEEIPVSIRDTQLTVELALDAREDGSLPKYYRIQVFDADGNVDPEPVVYGLEIRRDQPPVLRLLDPTRDLQVPSNAVVPMLIEAEDPDFLLRSVSLHYSVNGKPVQPSEVLLDTTKSRMPKRWVQTWEFRLAPLRLNPGDVVTYYVEARDNRPPLGNQSRSGELNLQISGPASDEAVEEQLNDAKELQEQQLRELQQDPGKPQQDPDTTAPLEPPTPEEATTPDSPQQPDNDAQLDPSETTSLDGNPSEAGNAQRQGENESSADDGKGNPSESKDADSNQNDPGSPSRKLDEDEALQRLIEQMNSRQPDGNDSESAADNSSSGKASDGQASGESRPRNSDTPESTEPRNESGAPESTEGSGEQKAANEIPSSSADSKDPGNKKQGNEPSSEDDSKVPADDSKLEQPEGKSGAGTTEQEEDAQKNGDGAQMPTTETGESTNPERSKNGKSPDEERQDSPTTSNSNSELNRKDANRDSNSNTDPAVPNTDNPDSPKPPNKDPLTEPGSEMSKPTEDKAGSDQTSETEPKPSENSNGGEKSTDAQKSSDPRSKNGDQGEPSNNSKDGAPDEMKSNDQSTQKPANEKAGESNDDSKDGSPNEAQKQQGTNEKSSDSEKPGAEESSDPEKSGATEKSDGQDSNSENDNSEKSGGEKSGGEKSGGEKSGGEKSGGEKSGGEKSGGEKSGGEKSGGEKSGGEKSGGEKSGGEKSGGEKSGGEKSGGEKSGGEKSGGEKSGGEKSGGEKSGGEKSGGEKSGGEKSGGEKSGGEKSGGEKSGGEKSGGEKSGGEKSGGEKSGGEKSGGEKSGGEKSGGEKSGGEKSGGEKSGGEKSGGEKSGGEKSGGEKSGGEKSGGEKSGGEKGGKGQGSGKGGDQPGKSGENGSPGGKGNNSGSTTSGKGKGSPGTLEAAGDGDAGAPDQKPTGADGNSEDVKEDPAIDEAAKAAGLALERLQQDLERGKVDPKLLEQLGWTEAELKDFADRLQEQLAEREQNSQQQRENELSQKSFEEMLRSLNVRSAGKSRDGSTRRDRDQQDTTGRQTAPPARYQQLYDMYRRSTPGAAPPPNKGLRAP
jgi:collagen type III alpha